VNPDIKCLIIPFYENSYRMKRDKVAFVCIQDIRQLIQFIEFKNSVSRWVERFQMRLSEDRFNPFNGILRTQAKMIYFSENKPKPVYARLYAKRIVLVTNDKATAYIKDYSLYQSRKTGGFFADEAIKMGRLSNNWNKDFEWAVTPDCCLVFPGESDTLIFCAANNKGTQLEKASDICRFKLEPFLKYAKMQIRAITLTENTYTLLSDSKKFKNCKSKEYKIFRQRVDHALTVSSVEDCKRVINYSDMLFEEKFRYCFKHYSDEMKLEVNLLSQDRPPLYNKLNDCFYKSSYFKKKLNSNFLKKLLGIKKKGKLSFIQKYQSKIIDKKSSNSIKKPLIKTVISIKK